MAGFNVVAFIEVTEQTQELVDFFRTEILGSCDFIGTDSQDC
jgi:hypothetical protein